MTTSKVATIVFEEQEEDLYLVNEDSPYVDTNLDVDEEDIHRWIASNEETYQYYVELDKQLIGLESDWDKLYAMVESVESQNPEYRGISFYADEYGYDGYYCDPDLCRGLREHVQKETKEILADVESGTVVKHIERHEDNNLDCESFDVVKGKLFNYYFKGSGGPRSMFGHDDGFGGIVGGSGVICVQDVSDYGVSVV